MTNSVCKIYFFVAEFKNPVTTQIKRENGYLEIPPTPNLMEDVLVWNKKIKELIFNLNPSYKNWDMFLISLNLLN